MDAGAANSVVFSVVIPTYNRRGRLEKCLASLSAQTYRNFEVLICDDGSTDDTAELVRSFTGKIPGLRYFYNDNWGGPAYPRNIGIGKAEGEWVCFLDSDDTWYPNKLEEIFKCLNEGDLLCHHFLIDGNEQGKKIMTANMSDPFTTLLTCGNSIVTSSVSVKTSILRDLNGFSLDKRLVAVEDLDLWLAIAKKGYKFKVVPMYLGGYWSGDENISQDSYKQIERVEFIYDKHLAGVNPGSAFYRHAQGFKEYLKARILHRMGKYGEARPAYINSFRMSTPATRIKAGINLLIAMAKK
jgi:glycosyltransferase involved in cell wall biosynthesis